MKKTLIILMSLLVGSFMFAGEFNEVTQGVLKSSFNITVDTINHVAYFDKAKCTSTLGVAVFSSTPIFYESAVEVSAKAEYADSIPNVGVYTGFGVHIPGLQWFDASLSIGPYTDLASVWAEVQTSIYFVKEVASSGAFVTAMYRVPFYQLFNGDFGKDEQFNVGIGYMYKF